MTITVAMALSGLEPEQWNDGLKEIYMQGAILFPKSPSSLSLASSSGASSYYSLESGISSMSSDLDSVGLPDGGVVRLRPNRTTTTTPVDDDEQQQQQQQQHAARRPTKPNKVYSQVMYGNRDVLNLFGNITRGAWRYQPTSLPDGINSFYFENRSQYSRLQDAYPPKHTTATCRCHGCGFVEEHYF